MRIVSRSEWDRPIRILNVIDPETGSLKVMTALELAQDLIGRLRLLDPALSAPDRVAEIRASAREWNGPYKAQMLARADEIEAAFIMVEASTA